jgi:hypothetical protein
MDGLAREQEQIQMGFLTHYAVNDPPKLEDELQAFREKAGFTLSREDALSLAMETVEKMKRLKAGTQIGG